ncbi:MAG: 4-carboxy-4-hydroxy-2-oxoadipate aldolase/oxaloacetate decarboxylase [Thaumarchaeota archaeon]|nr:4-carboxy-4-hydroxy-2-oxoadipate aldolase/oxaloacetate decarboxylase [Nitrososphaerota archaeon]
MSVIVKDFERPPASQISKLAGAGVSTIHECLGSQNANLMRHDIKPLSEGMSLVGPAVTVDCSPGDNLTIHIAVAFAKPGDVLVVNGHGIPAGMWGSQMAFQAVHRGIKGIIVDGAVRDSKDLRRMKFPTFAKMISSQGTVKKSVGSVNVAIQCGGVVVKPGDVVVGDDDGVVVVPRHDLQGLPALVRKREKKEAENRKLYAKGVTSMELNHYDDYLKDKKVRVVRDARDL